MNFLICALLLSQICFSQTSQKTIVVQGKSRMMVKPDIAFITFSIEKTDTSQSKAMAKANEQIEALSIIMMQQGVLNKQIKASEYSIRNEYNNLKHKMEYSVSNSLVATIPMNGKLVNEVLKGIEAKKMNGVEISFDYQISDSLEQVVRILLVQQAITNAKSNANHISRALDIGLKNIIQITKEGIARNPLQIETAKFAPPVIKQDSEIKSDSMFYRYDIEDKELTEEITIIYEISS
jgi:uncharacterized protein YggE